MKKIKIQCRIDDLGAAKHDVITGLVLNKDWTRVLHNGVPVYPDIIMRRALSNDRDFFVKLGRALTRAPRTYKNALVHNFIFVHWDELKSLTAEKACEVLSKKFSDRPVFTPDNYRKILKRLQLRPDK